MNDIHENLQLIQLPIFTIFDWIIAVIILVGLIYIFVKYFKQSVIDEEVIIPKPVFKPKQFLLSSEIKKLIKIKNKKNWKQFALKATNLLKTVLEKRMNKQLMFATGKEMEELLMEDITISQMTDLKRFFQVLDPVKFAHISAKDKVADEIITIIKRLNK